MEKSKRNVDILGLIDRQNYLVVQANDLAKGFGNLTSIEHKILDYCISCIKKDDVGNEKFVVNIKDILRLNGMSLSGGNYKLIVDGFDRLRKKTSLYIPEERNGEKGVILTNLFEEIFVSESGVIEFWFGRRAIPLLFELKENYYSFELLELLNIRSKYTHILLKLWKAHSNKKISPKYTQISGTPAEMKKWFLSDDVDGKSWSNGRFTQKVLNVAIKELEEKYECSVLLTTEKSGRKITRYVLNITDLSV